MIKKIFSSLLIVLMVVSLIPMFVPNFVSVGFAATVGSEDFESGAISYPPWYSNTGTGGTLNVSSSISNNGSYSAHFYKPTSTSRSRLWGDFDDDDEYHVGFSVYLENNNVDPVDCWLLWAIDGDTDQQCVLTLNTESGSYYIGGNSGAFNDLPTFYEISPHVWYDIDVYINQTSDYYYLFIEDDYVLRGNLQYCGAIGERVFFGSTNEGGEVAEFYLDDIIIDDEWFSEYVWKSGFETGNWTDFDVITYTSATFLNVTTDGAKTGTYGADFYHSSIASYYKYLGNQSDQEWTEITASIRLDDAVTGTEWDLLFFGFGAWFDGVCSVGFGSDSPGGDIYGLANIQERDSIYDYYGDDNITLGSVVRYEDEWYDVRILFKDSATGDAGKVKIYFEDELLVDRDDIITFNVNNTAFSDGLWICNNGEVDTTYDFSVDDLNVEAGVLEVSLDANFEDIDDDGADWVFTDWKYYDFTLSISEYVSSCGLFMVLPTSFENIAAGFFMNASGFYQYSSNMTYDSRYGEPVNLGQPTWWDDGESTVVNFPIFFNDLVLDLWDQNDGIDVYFSYNASEYSLLESDFFRIYSEGGFTMNTEASNSSQAYLLPGGDAFSFHVDNNEGAGAEWMYNEFWSRDVNHLKLLPEISFLAGRSTVTVRYGCDYSTGDGEWLDGWYVLIQPHFVSYTGVYAANVWINYTCHFYNRGESVDYTVLYGFYHGSVSASGDEARMRSWIDLWISDKNASSVAAARVNAYEYPMVDTADLWLRWLANNWGVKDDVPKEFASFNDLLKSDNSSRLSSESIKMVRYWCNATVLTAGGDQYIELDNYAAFDSTHSPQLPLNGVSDPVFDETIIPTVGNKGILGALWTMFSSLGTFLSENILFGGLDLWGNFVSFLDTIAGYLGAPTFFSDLFGWIDEALANVGEAFSYIVEIAGDLFALFGSVLGTFLDTMGELISSLVSTIQVFTDFMGGAYGVGVDMWETFGIGQWLQIAMILYPLYLVILWEQEGAEPVIKQLSWIFGLLVWVFNFMSGLIIDAVHLITALIESIPVVE